MSLPQYLLVEQIEANAKAIGQNLSVLYDPETPFEYKQVALSYVYAQGRQIQQLVDGLYGQFKQIEQWMARQ